MDAEKSLEKRIEYLRPATPRKTILEFYCTLGSYRWLLQRIVWSHFKVTFHL